MRVNIVAVPDAALVVPPPGAASASADCRIAEGVHAVNQPADEAVHQPLKTVEAGK